MLFIKPGYMEEYNTLSVYNEDNVLRIGNLNSYKHDKIEIDNKYLSHYEYDGMFIDDIHGVAVDGPIRRALKLNLKKNDIFSLKEYEGHEPIKTLYIPCKFEKIGTAKTYEDKFGYHLADKIHFSLPIMLKVSMAKRNIPLEEVEKLTAKWHNDHHWDDNGTKHEIKKSTKGQYNLLHHFDLVVPEFTLLMHREAVKNEYYNQTNALAQKINKVLSTNVFSHYDVDKLLEVFDIKEKQED